MIDERGHDRADVAAAARSAASARRRARLGALTWAERLSVLRSGSALRGGPDAMATARDPPRPCGNGWASRPGAAAVRAVLGAARACRAESVDRSRRRASSSSTVLERMFGPIPTRPRCCCRRCRSTISTPSRRAMARGSAATCRVNARRACARRRAASPASGSATSTIDGADRDLGRAVVRVWRAVRSMPPPRWRDRRERRRARELADRDRQPVVRRAGHPRDARRPARPHLPMGVRQRRHRRRGASHLSLVSSGAAAIVRAGQRCARRIALAELREAVPAARAATLRQGLGGARKARDLLAGPRRAAAAADRDAARRVLPGGRLDRHGPAGDDRVARSCPATRRAALPRRHEDHERQSIRTKVVFVSFVACIVR